MHPIKMQAGNRGIGMGYDQFVEAFQAVCREHLQDGRARAFAFVCYDMSHGVVRDALSQAHGFHRLHEKTGQDVLPARHGSQRLLAALQLVVHGSARHHGLSNDSLHGFFRVSGGNIEDVSIYAIDSKSNDPGLTVAELEKYVDDAVKKLNAEGEISALTSLAAAAVQFAGLLKFADFLRKISSAA